MKNLITKTDCEKYGNFELISSPNQPSLYVLLLQKKTWGVTLLGLPKFCSTARSDRRILKIYNNYSIKNLIAPLYWSAAEWHEMGTETIRATNHNSSRNGFFFFSFRDAQYENLMKYTLKNGIDSWNSFECGKNWWKFTCVRLFRAQFATEIDSTIRLWWP